MFLFCFFINGFDIKLDNTQGSYNFSDEFDVWLDQTINSFLRNASVNIAISSLLFEI